MTTYALKLTSDRVHGERILPQRFYDKQQAMQLVRSVSNDPFWRDTVFSRGPIHSYAGDYIVKVAGGFLRVVQV